MTSDNIKTTLAGGRGLAVRVKTAKGRKSSSTRWLKRQLNDPYVAHARSQGYRSRAAFKLVELDSQLNILRRGLRVLDLGAAPGGWTQVALERVGSSGKVFALDNREWEEVAGATCLTFDFLDLDATDRLLTVLGGPIDVVLSDMAAPSTGHSKTDHIRIITLAEEAWNFAEQILSNNGTFVCKVFQGGTEGELLKKIRKSFTKVTHNKPPASRKESAEVYLVAKGFKKLKELVAVS